MSSLTLKAPVRRPGRIEEIPRYLAILVAFCVFSVTAVTTHAGARPPDFFHNVNRDTVSYQGLLDWEAPAPTPGIPPANLAYPLDPVPVPADSQWWDGFGRPGVSGTVRAMTVFEGNLLVGGDFVTAGKVRAVDVGAWDGSEWASVTDPVGRLQSLAVYDGELYAGRLGWCGDILIQVWTGNSWETPGDGIRAWDDTDYYHPQCYDFPMQVSCLQVYDGRLIAGGDFWEVEGNPEAGLAQWDGEEWTGLGSNLNSPVNTMTLYEGNLIIGGWFTHVGDTTAFRIAAWDGISWSALGTGINDDVEAGRCVYALEVHAGDLYAGGVFNKAGSTHVDRLACWDGSEWSSVGFEAGGYIGDDVPAVFSLASHDGEIVVGGRFNKAEGAVGDYIAARDGSSWHELGSGLSGPVYSLRSFEGVLIAGGNFKFAGSKVVYNVAIWDGETWQPMGLGEGLDKPARTLALYGGGLVAGGEFTIAGDTLSNVVATWDGTAWIPMHEGWSYVRAGQLVSHGEDIFGKHGHVVKRWNGSSWQDYTTDFGEDIRTLTFCGGDLAAAGSRVAQWNGSSWVDLGPASDGYVKALMAAGDDLIAGGHFTEIGGIEARNVARWDGVEWSPMGEGLLLLSGYRFDDEAVSSLGFFEGSILAGGNFIWSGNTMVKSTAMWDGVAWQPLYKGISRDTHPEIYAFCIYNGTLIAGGDFRQAGDLSAWNIARWNGASWSPLGSGIGVERGTARYVANALAVYEGMLYAAGDFPGAGGKTSFHIARWKDAFPGMIMHFKASVGGENIHLTWTNPETGLFRGTLIRYSMDSYPLEPGDGEPVPNGNQGRFEGPAGSDSSFVFTGPEGATHYVTAFAYDDDFNYSTPAFAPIGVWDTIPPPPLSHFEASPGTCSVRLAWTNPQDPQLEGTLIRFSRDGYPQSVEDGEAVPNGFSGVFANPDGAVVYFVHDDLDCDTTYYYSAWAFDHESNFSDPSYAAVRSADPPESPPPSAFSTSSLPEGILLEWTNPATGGFESVIIRYSVGDFPVHTSDGDPVPNTNNGVFEGTPGADSSFIHSGVVTHQVYYYGAWATYEGGGLSVPLYRFETAPDTTKLSPPDSLTAEPIPDGISLRWTNSEDVDTRGVRIHFSQDTYPGETTDGEPLPNGDEGMFEGVPGGAGSFYHTDLPGCSMFYYTAWAYDEFERYSEPVHAAYISVIDTAGEFLAIPGDSSVYLHWTVPQSDSCDYINAAAIRYSTVDYVYTTEDGRPVPNGNDGRFAVSKEHDSYSFHHTGLDPDSTYKYSIFVVCDDPERTSSPLHMEATPLKVMPGVTDFTSTGEDHAVSLEWTAPEDPTLAGIEIRYATEAAPQGLDEGLPVENGNDGVFETAPGAADDFIHTDRENGTTYYYSAWAFDDDGNYSDPQYAEATAVDNQPPSITVSVLQNPYLSEYLDIYMRASEEVVPDSVVVSVGSDTLVMHSLDGEYNLWRGDYTLTYSVDSIDVVACACDTAGNRACVSSDFAAGYVCAHSGGMVSSPDSKLRLTIPPDAMRHDAFILVLPCAGSETRPNPEPGSGGTAVPLTRSGEGSAVAGYRLSPEGILGASPARLEMTYSADDVEPDIAWDRLYIERGETGALPSYVDPARRLIEAEINQLGTYRLAVGSPGSSHIVDPAFLRVGSPRPNPFERSTTISFEVRATQHLRAVIYDIAGREVCRLLDETLNPGQKQVTWAGRSSSGPVPSGVYFIKISTDRKSATRKLLLLR